MYELNYGDFVQVEKPVYHHDTQTATHIWVNALYVTSTKKSHVVIYANGMKEEIEKIKEHTIRVFGSGGGE